MPDQNLDVIVSEDALAPKKEQLDMFSFKCLWRSTKFVWLLVTYMDRVTVFNTTDKMYRNLMDLGPLYGRMQLLQQQ